MVPAPVRWEYAVRVTATLAPEDRDRLLIRVLEIGAAAVPTGRAARATTAAELRSVGVGDRTSRTRWQRGGERAVDPCLSGVAARPSQGQP